MNKTIGLMALVLASSAAHAKLVTTEDNTAQKSVPVKAQPAPVVVQDQQKVKGFYLGAGVGSTKFDSLDFDAPNFKEDGNTFKFIAGYQFSRVFSLEGQYTQYGDIRNDNNRYSWSPSAISIATNLGYSFHNGLRPFGVIGLSSIDLGESVTYPSDEVSVGVRYGFGLEYAPVALRGLSARLGYEVDLFVIDNYYRSDSYTLSSFYASVAYKF
ncbi:Outer membrane protein [Moritella sp. JT01]|uniref:porin family protein n=1 Tax=Moritella sp. JT01 TaxID=756698 RepID=UPI000797F359|nr:porin family protein [Moritella sp. JT01]KXO10131.1 Outer membrane protein [Moritella sp. JT01]